MNPKHLLAILFASILLSLAVMTIWASVQQPVWQWRGLTTGVDRWWTIATLMDAYFGFLTFFVWVCFKECRMTARVLWFIAIMALGNMAMASYVLLQLARLERGAPVRSILTSRRTA
jgi:hypothetical protein